MDDDVLRELANLQYGHLEHRTCSEAFPMKREEKDRYRWSHPDAVRVGDFFNLIICECPRCGLRFTCLPPKRS